MNPENATVSDQTDESLTAASDQTDESLTAENLIEEVSIDGMCGVY